ncbi:MAG: hypothetical protein AAGA63_09180 [Pseudomonadota bacterium]
MVEPVITTMSAMAGSACLEQPHTGRYSIPMVNCVILDDSKRIPWRFYGALRARDAILG